MSNTTEIWNIFSDINYLKEKDHYFVDTIKSSNIDILIKFLQDNNIEYNNYGDIIAFHFHINMINK